MTVTDSNETIADDLDWNGTVIAGYLTMEECLLLNSDTDSTNDMNDTKCDCRIITAATPNLHNPITTFELICFHYSNKVNQC
jgi:hypothetical protein